MWITEFKDYKSFLKAHFKKLPKAGRGQSRRLAEYLRVAPIVVSQILARDRDLTPDQAVKTAAYFGFDSATTEYFIFLVQLARAESRELKSFYNQKLNLIREESEKIKNIVRGREQLSEVDKAIFYSNWYYSGVRNLSAIEGYQTVDAIAEYFKLDRNVIAEIVSFLVRTGLCIEEQGEIRPGVKSTHVSAESHFVNSHRRNWHDKAKEKFTRPSEKDLFTSIPVSMSKQDADAFRKDLLDLIKNFSKTVEPSKAETLMCLNIDWFGF